MRIALSYRVDSYPKEEGGSPKQRAKLLSVPVESYARCVHRELQELGHIVDNVYYSNEVVEPKYYDVYLELDNGRDPEGKFQFLRKQHLPIPTAVWFIDSHGQPDLHKGLAPMYDHVFFAVWARRDLFAGHTSAHWCPNASDPRFFYQSYKLPEFDFGFFGSRMGLNRADEMKKFCEVNGWTYDIRQVGGGPFKHKWPRTSDAMNNCRILFNRGQKHDGPNQRVIESMLVCRPLITEVDKTDGMSQLFTEGEHFLGYEAYTWKGLEEKMRYAITHTKECTDMAIRARELVMEKHLIKHRVQQMLEVFHVSSK